MSWIQDNKFLVGLGGTTLVLAIVLYMIGSSGAGRFKAAQEIYETNANEAAKFESGKLYPTEENVDGKRVALEEYAESVEDLQAAFEAFRPEASESISPQQFSDILKKANEETREAFGEKLVIPDSYYCGFESYATGNVASGKATEILDFQLQVIKGLMLKLADSGATQLMNIHRPALPEEMGKGFKPSKDQVARGLPLELTFQGPESAIRELVSDIANPGQHYVVIRSLRITNVKQLPPKTTDAKFDRPDVKSDKASEGPAGFFDDVVDGPGNIFDQTDTGDATDAPSDDSEAPTPEIEVAPPVIPAPSNDSSRMLSQILGNEEVRIFLRLDVMKFLPAQKLP